MVFVYLLAFSAFLLAAVAGYFSIYGLASIFSGWFWEIIAMGVALEYGKLIAASYLFRFRHLEGKTGRIYGASAIVTLMLITSAGIFGFLSQGYQQDTLSLKQQEQRIGLVISEQKELSEFKAENINRKKQIDKDIAALPNNYITGRQRLMESYGPELEIIKKDIANYTQQINEKTLELSKIKQEKLINEVHIGPIIFIAKAFDTDTDEAVKWLIFMLIFAFDPLAVWLTLATNRVIIEKAKDDAVEPEPIVDEHFKVNVQQDEHIVEPPAPAIIVTENPTIETPAARKVRLAKEAHDKDTSSKTLPAHSLRK